MSTDAGREARPAEISEEEFEAAKADAFRRWGAIPPSLQRVIDLGGRFGRADALAADGE
jgi:hypothetical protein